MTPLPTARRVLIVEDDLDLAELTAHQVASLGHHVVCVHTGARAIAVAFEFDPEVVLLDLGLPDLDGIEVAHRLRAWASRRVPVIAALTGRCVDPAAAGGALDHYLEKPVPLATLARVIDSKRVLAHGRRHADLVFGQVGPGRV